jgi:hypothetical protein
MTTTELRSTTITNLSNAAGVSEQIAWETVKDICGAYDRRRPVMSSEVFRLAKSMWIDPTFRLEGKSLALLAAAVRFANGHTVEPTFELIKQEWDRDGVGLVCDHPLCDRFHKKGCPTPGGRIWVSWIFVDAITGERKVPWQISDNFDRKRDAKEALARYKPAVEA